MKITIYAVSTCIPERGEKPISPDLFGTEAEATAYLEKMLKAEWETFGLDDFETGERLPYPGNWQEANDQIAVEYDDGSWGQWKLTSHEIEIGDQTAANGDALCAANGNDFWGEYADQPRSDWRYQVANGDTSLGYWEWAAARVESEIDELSPLEVVSDDEECRESLIEAGWRLANAEEVDAGFSKFQHKDGEQRDDPNWATLAASLLAEV